MAKSKKKTARKPSVKIEDLAPSRNPSGGNKIVIEYKEQKPDGTTSGTIKTTMT